MWMWARVCVCKECVYTAKPRMFLYCLYSCMCVWHRLLFKTEVYIAVRHRGVKHKPSLFSPAFFGYFLMPLYDTTSDCNSFWGEKQTYVTVRPYYILLFRSPFLFFFGAQAMVLLLCIREPYITNLYEKSFSPRFVVSYIFISLNNIKM